VFDVATGYKTIAKLAAEFGLYFNHMSNIKRNYSLPPAAFF